MASPRSHPRRSSPSPFAQRTLSPLVVATATAPLGLKKGSTFHAPTSPSREHDPVLNVPSLPSRSYTGLKELDDDIIATHPSERIARVIGAVDRSFSDLQAYAADVRNLVGDETPIPAFMVSRQHDPAAAAAGDGMEVDALTSPPAVRKHHASDSGIGSTVSSDEPSVDKEGPKAAPEHATGRVQTGINGDRSVAPAMAALTQHVLSEYACRQIQKHIILPIVREEKLKNFHPLVHGLPYRIARKEITCLRDLEKVLLWLAPKWSISKASFLLFCETTIQCLHTAVEHLNERDQCRPNDRPYTNGYFVDLVEQVRQYAAQLAATRSRMAADERVELIGGLGHTGQPAELVRTKDGQSVSLRTGDEVTDEYPQSLKRSSLEIEEELERSMARRRKNAPIEKQIQKCHECDKVFKRPCDLTKHEKTHSRPWKCPEENCKYHEYGWPTEKERDRHVNDKHSATPTLFKCRFHPCPYESKRESNCKQHMEKAHGWTYVKSKSNGKTPARQGPGATPPTPVDSIGSNLTSPQQSLQSYNTSPAEPRRGSFGGSTLDNSSSGVVSPVGDFDLNFTTAPPLFQWINDDAGDLSFDFNNFDPQQATRPWGEGAMSADVAPSVFNVLPEDDVPIFGESFDWGHMDHDLSAFNMQLATPPPSLERLPAQVLKGVRPPPMQAVPHPMLYSPYSMHSNEAPLDEGYGGDFTQSAGKPMGDFSLFDTQTVSSLSTAPRDVMFDDLANFGTYGRTNMGDYMMQE